MTCDNFNGGKNMLISEHTIYLVGTTQALRYSIQEVSAISKKYPISPDMLRIVYIRSGHCTWVISGNKYFVKAGDIVLLNNTERRYQTDVDPSEPVFQEVIRFMPVTFEDCADYLPLFFNRTQNFTNVLSNSYPHRDKIITLIDWMREEADNNALHKDQNMLSLLRLILINLSRMGEELGMITDSRCPYGQNMRHYQTICDAINYIKANLSEELSATILAERTGVSRCYFSRIFHALMGMTIPQYIRILRIRNTRELINNKQYSILDAVYESGFGSVSSYYKALHSLQIENE